MNDVLTDLRSASTLVASTACYERIAERTRRDMTPLDVVEILMTVVPCRVYPRSHLIHVRRCVEVDACLPASDLEVKPVKFHPERHVLVTCGMSHANQSLGLDTTLCGARVRGWSRGGCVVWWQ